MMNEARDDHKIAREEVHLAVTVVRRSLAENRRRVHGRERAWAERAIDHVTSLFRHAEIFSEHRLRGGGTKKHDDLGLDEIDFFFEPEEIVG